MSWRIHLDVTSFLYHTDTSKIQLNLTNFIPNLRNREFKINTIIPHHRLNLKRSNLEETRSLLTTEKKQKISVELSSFVLVCGQNICGQLGLSSTIIERHKPQYLKITNHSDVIENIRYICAGAMHSCALTITGHVYTWGSIMDIIIRRHQATGGTILIVAHAPSLEGLTRHFSGGKYLPEKLFDIARRVPFLAMTILERNSLESPWLFRTLPLQTDRPASMIETEIEQSLPTSIVKPMGHNHSINHQGQPKQVSRHHQQHDPYSSPVQNASQYVRHNQQHQRPQEIENLRYHVSNGGMPVELQKLTKSSTLPDLQTSRSYTEMFHVI
ncbi:unnamed protein product [Adineta steineri]|uniref:Uncharacterized protein n=1 Tax=Adineta steineri TaxID=433720 RepID=A0A815LSK2_9BILA|nr:unnamed protein product [Adineta steineri]